MILTPHFKLLLSLWWKQKRRTFSWMRAFGVVYFGGLMLVLVVAMMLTLAEYLQSGEAGDIPLDQFMLLLAASLALPDFMMKMLWGTDAVIMDDCVRTKPVSSRTWNRFVAFSLLADPWNWLMPLLAAIIAFWLLPVGVALTAVVAVTVQSQMLSWAVACIHKAPGNQYTLPLWAGLLVYDIGVMAAGGIVMVMAMMGEGRSWHIPGSPWTELLLLIALNAVLIRLLSAYFDRLQAWDEHEQQADHVRSVGEITLFSTEYLSVWRSKRMRTPTLLLTGIFLLQAYQWASDTMTSDFGGLNIGLYFSLGWPSLFLGQWVFGIEANYFHGLWTKPYSVEQMLVNKFRFFTFLTIVMAVLLLPAAIWMNIRLTQILALLLMESGFQALLMMGSCQYSTRIDLFSTAFFNTQGTNAGINLYSLLLFVPFGIYVACVFSLPPLWGDAVMAAIGLVCLAFHRPYLRWLANRWVAHRHRHMERYLSK